jgi:regulator of sigma E protease
VITGRRSVKELGGPLKIAQYSGQQVSLGLAAVHRIHGDDLD